MNLQASSHWYQANQRHLAGALARVRQLLQQAVAQSDRQNCACATEEAPEHSEAAWTLAEPPALQMLCSAFQLSPFERDVLVLCAGAEMDAQFPPLFAALHKDAHAAQPTFALALAALPNCHWSAVSPGRPLRRWSLLEVAAGQTVTSSPLRIQESVLHYLAGVPALDEKLQPLLRAVPEPHALPPSQQAIAEQIAATWTNSEAAARVVQLCGTATSGKRDIAAAACAMCGLRLYVARTWSLPQNANDIETLLRIWEREAVLTASAMLLECDDDHDLASATVLSWFIENVRTPLIVSGGNRRRCAERSVLLFNVENPTRAEQGDIWRNFLPDSAERLNGKLDSLVSQFNLGATAIEAAACQAAAEADSSRLAERLWDACRAHSRPRLEGLAQHIPATARWDELVVPENQRQVLAQIAMHVRQRAKVYQSWGFAAKTSRGLGISALFAGPSGTGKTMAAEVLANELQLDLYRIDLSQVVSKYIGETEKNLGRVFDAADEGAAVLLFDEADALFGKRSEVKDSHDRYANIEVSYLLQRMESYRGLAILTTNRKSALDQAFLRRIRFVVEFPFPEAAQRAEIWRRVFPEATPTDGINIERLARLHATGGHIRNIAMGAAFLAADAEEPVRMSHLLCSARSEFTKLEKPLADAEIAGWV